MKDLDPMMFVAVFQEMLGPVLWVLIALAVAGLAMLVLTLVRERGIDSRRLVRSELAGLAGGAAALVLMAWATHSGFTDAGGPVDWLLIGVIFGAGAAGTTVLAYAVSGCLRRCGGIPHL
ncbi:MAG: DUF5368 domain-containing protein [Rhodospirillaceae bacterium]